jgi:hypothetical protein
MRSPIALLAGMVATLLVATPALAQEDEVRIHLIHGIPGVDVDVWAGGEPVFEGFAFGDTQDLSALAGGTLEGLEVRVAGTEDVAIDAGDVSLPASGNYTVIAHLTEDGTPTLAVFENDTSTIAAGSGRLTVRHTAAAPAVDVLAGDEPAFTELANPDEASADLPAGTLSASVVPTGATEPVVIGPADLAVEEGSSLIVYAVGSLDDESLTVLTESITGIGSTPASVDTGNSPVDDGSTPTIPLIGIAVGIAMVVTGLAFSRRHRQDG